MLRVDSVEGLLGVRTPFCVSGFPYPVFGTRFPRPIFAPGAPGSTGLTPVSGYTGMHNFAAAHPRRCEFAHLCSGGVRPLYEALLWFHF